MSDTKTRNIIWTQARVAEVVAEYARSLALRGEPEMALAGAATLAASYTTREVVRAKLIELGLYDKPEKPALDGYDEGAIKAIVDHATDLAMESPPRAILLMLKTNAAFQQVRKAIKDGSVGGGPVGHPTNAEPALDLGEPPVLATA